jgi:hypothetical protein
MPDAERRDAEGESRLGRRQFLLKAAVAGTVAFAVPTIVTVDPAGATGLHSPPPEEVLPTGVTDPMVVPGGVSAGGELPRTGVGTEELVAAGLAATAGGAAMLFWSADGEAVPAPVVDIATGAGPDVGAAPTE